MSGSTTYSVSVNTRPRSLRIREQLPEEGWIASGLAALSIANRLAGNLEIAVAQGEQALDTSLRLGLRAIRVDSARRTLEQAMTARAEAST